MTPLRPRLAALALLLATAAACSGSASPPPQGLRVVATTTVLADLVHQVGGERVIVTTLVPKGGEVHTFDPRPSDIVAVTNAQLVFVNGLGLDDWVERLTRDAGATASIVRLADSIPADRLIGDPDAGTPNPHLWLDPANAMDYARSIGDELGSADPAARAAFEARAEAYADRLRALDGWARAQFATISAADRRIVSFHDALPYFAAAYGLKIEGVVVPAPGQDPSAGEVAALIDAIRRSGVKVVASEIQFSDRLARAIADETGASVVADLYTDSLGSPPVDSYEGLIRWDVERLVVALGG